MPTASRSPRFRRVLVLSALAFIYSVIFPTRVPNRFYLYPSKLQAAPPDADSQPGPQPPCGKDPIPAYPSLGDGAVVKSWSKADYGRDWKPSGCTSWTDAGFTTLVTIAARFQYLDGAEGLLRRAGAISELAGLRYWSTTHKQWRTLIADAFAVNDPQLGQRRADFAPDEMKAGQVLYFEQADNLSGKAIYRLNVVSISPSRIVFGIENVSTLRYHLIPIMRPGALQSMYFLERESENVWRFYSIVRIGQSVSTLLAGNESSSINRAVAFYRYLVGIPATQEPPAAR